MSRRLPKKDVVIVGLGWTGSIMAQELTDEGLEVTAIERGPWRDAPTDFPPTYMPDELRYRIRHELFLRPDQTTFTFRNKVSQTALPIRSWGAFMPPNGVGGGGVHWNAETWRFLPSDFVLRTHLTQRYGAKFLPQDMTIQDWGITYQDLELYYDRFLRQVRVPLRHLRHRRQSQGADPGRRQSIRRTPVAALPDPRSGSALRLSALCQGRARARLQALPPTLWESVEAVQESPGCSSRRLHLLWILRMVWLRQLLEGEPNH